MRGGELGGDDGGQRVVTTDTHAHDEPPYDEDTDDVDSVSLTRDRLTEGCDDDEHELDTIFLEGQQEP